jgi:amidase
MTDPAFSPKGVLQNPAPSGAQGASEITELGALALSRAIHAKDVSCEEVMAAYLCQIERFNPRVSALVSLRDPEVLRTLARERDSELARGQSRGWMHGFPHAIKDLVETAGLTTTRGSPLLREFVPAADALLVERIKGAGAIVIGKTNVPEFGYGSQTYNSVFGTTLNAYDPTKTAGGSSGGAAVALALRMLPVADGSDTMGSLRNPAAFNNVVGLRPSLGRVPSAPNADVFYRQLGTEGPMGRSVADVAMLLSTLAGFDRRSPLSARTDAADFALPLDLKTEGLRIGWMADLNGHLAIEPGILEMCEKALANLGQLGCVIEPVMPAFSMDRLWDTWLTLRHWTVAASLGEFAADPQTRAQLKPEVIWEIEGARHYSALDIARAGAARSEWYQVLRRLFETFDYLALPVAQVFPFDAQIHWPERIAGRAMDTYHRWMEVVIGATLAGLPAISVPIGLNSAGLPMGLQIIGPALADRAVLQIAHAFETVCPYANELRPALLDSV